MEDKNLFTQEIMKRLLAAEKPALTDVDRLGLAYCRLNCGQWDDILGNKPNSIYCFGADEFPSQIIYGVAATGNAAATEIMAAIQTIIGEANTSRCWWNFILGKSEREWFRWYTVDRSLSKVARFETSPEATAKTSTKVRKVKRRYK